MHGKLHIGLICFKTLFKSSEMIVTKIVVSVDDCDDDAGVRE